VDREELLRDIAALGEEFERLGTELGETARALREQGMPPPPRSFDAVEWARQGFERLRAQVLELAQGSPSVTVPGLEGLRSLGDLLALLEDVAASHRRRAAHEQARRTALVVLDRVQALAHRETAPFPPLVSCQAEAAELRARVAAAATDLHPDIEALVTGAHPFSMLLALVQRFAELEDEHWERLRDTVGAHLGRPLAMAASRGKLALGAVVEAPRPAEPVQAVEAPAPSEAVETAAAPVAGRAPAEPVAAAPVSPAPPSPAPVSPEPEEPVPPSGSVPEPTLSAHAGPAARAALETLRSGGFLAALRDESPAWLRLPGGMRSHLAELAEFAQDVARLGYSHAVVIGVGSAVAVPRACAGFFPSKLGYPELLILDSLDPATIRRTIDHLDLLHTLFLVCARGDIPPETLALYRLCRERAEQALPAAGKQFVAITQAGAPLEAFARDHQFRRAFLVPAELGEAHTALSWTGLVPAALIGVNLPAFLARAEEMTARALGPAAAADNPGIALGALARAGRNKVTFVLSPRLEAFGSWLEHLLSGLADHDGRGLVPIVGESLGTPASYRPDRLFVALTLAGDTDADMRLSVLELVDQPVYRIVLRDSLDLAGEMVRWQIAAATAARLLNISDAGPTRAPGGRSSEGPRPGRLPFDARPQAKEGGIKLYLEGPARPASVTEGLAAYLALARPGDWLTLLSYLPAEAEVDAELHALRTAFRDRLRIATRLGRRPRYLEAVGALPVGAAADGLFIQITGEDRDDVAVPGERATFGGLKRAQVLRDSMALRDGGRKVLRLHVDGAPAIGLRRLAEMVQQVAAKA